MTNIVINTEVYKKKVKRKKCRKTKYIINVQTFFLNDKKTISKVTDFYENFLQISMHIKGTVSVILSELPFKFGNARFTTVPF